METENKIEITSLIDKVPTDVSGKWVKKEELYTFALEVADYVLSVVEKKLYDPNV